MGVKTGAPLSNTDLSWRHFIATGAMGTYSVRPEIEESWRRCYEAGVDPHDGTSHLVLNRSELNRLLRERKDLIDVARPFMANLHRFVEGSGFIVMLTDEQGFILEALGDNDTLEDAAKINFVPGASWIEEEVGTNAIGTALVLKRPLQVSGSEHYCYKHHRWTCSAAPIFDTDGRMIGILDMSGPSHETHLHTLGMVVAAVEAITHQMKIRQKNRELTLTNCRLNNIFQTMSDGVIIIDQHMAVNQINPVAKQVLGGAETEIIGRLLSDIFAGKAPHTERMLAGEGGYTDVEVMVDAGNGRIHCLASAMPIKDDTGDVTGGVVFLRPIEKIQRLVNRFSGAQATLHFKDIIGNSKEIRDTIRLASLAATGMSTILLQGESGTGKEVFAQAIHNRSSRRKGPFVAVNCGAIPRELVASELFGYAEGAFTGAKRGGRPGKFEMASGGTLFLDEIGDMPLEQQVTLLRVLEENRICRIGNDRMIPVDVRVICATNKNLPEEIAKGNFRQDLYYRLNVVSITIPPLRERREDISLLFRYFLDKLARQRGIEFEGVEPEVMECLQRYSWPGNVRELQNVVERIVSFADGSRICMHHLPPDIYQPPAVPVHPEPSSFTRMVRAVTERQRRKEAFAERERMELLSLLTRYGGNVSQVARELGVSRNTIYRKMKLYGIEN